MRIELRADSVLIEGYVNAVARDSRPMRDKDTGKRFVGKGLFQEFLNVPWSRMRLICFWIMTITASLARHRQI